MDQCTNDEYPGLIKMHLQKPFSAPLVMHLNPHMLTISIYTAAAGVVFRRIISVSS